MRALVLLALAALAACSSPPPTDPLPLAEDDSPARGQQRRSGSPAPAPTPSPSGSEDPPLAPPAPSAPPADAGVPATTWSGALPSSATVGFGGDPYCSYRITLKRIATEVTANEAGKVLGATVTAQAIEEAVAPCPHAAMPANDHAYELSSWTVLASGVTRIELAPKATNHPAASLVLEADLRMPAPEATLAWHRTDVSAPLDWRVNAKLTVLAK